VKIAKKVKNGAKHQARRAHVNHSEAKRGMSLVKWNEAALEFLS
jgi:hypothetical protein